jgi:hypothetical protein
MPFNQDSVDWGSKAECRDCVRMICGLDRRSVGQKRRRCWGVLPGISGKVPQYIAKIAQETADVPAQQATCLKKQQEL